MSNVPFNRPPLTGKELTYLEQVIVSRSFSGNGNFTARCHDMIQAQIGVAHALITQSCTAALEMAALLLDLEPGDEVIMPSFTFVSMANAVVLRRAVPVFVDIRPDTLNVDETLVEAAITRRTKAIIVVHYAGVCAEMDAICEIAARHGLCVVEDAAHALLSTYKGRPAGQLGNLACFSFHETKNITSGEGGALAIADERFVNRACILWEKGTNRRAFKAGAVDKYTWVDLGSSFLPSEFTAAILLAQLESARALNRERLDVWHRYYQALGDLEAARTLTRPVVPDHCVHNGHIFYVLLPTRECRDQLIEAMTRDKITAPFHYIPLHSSPAGQRFGRSHGALSVTDDIGGRLLRLPLYSGMEDQVVDRVLERLRANLLPGGRHLCGATSAKA